MSHHSPQSTSPLHTRLNLTFEQGRILLDQQRMILLHTGTMAALRKELMDTLGEARARGVLTRMGYASGQQDAQLARALMPDASDEDLLMMGPRLHSLEGIVDVQPIALEIDIPNGIYRGEFLWRGSHEAEVHGELYGTPKEPVCWNQIGYATGYTSAIMGCFIAYREVECCACGAADCRIVGRPLEEWPDPEAEARYYKPDPLAEQLFELQHTLANLRDKDETNVAFGDMIGNSDCFRHTCELLRKAAGSCASVLLLGETGVGKEMCARALHSISPRSEGPFIAINCAAIPEELIESELFGVEKGAFTGAHHSRPGRFERANGGTLFLDEVGELSPAAQAKLLRILQEGEVERLGGVETHQLDVRIVAATNEDLSDLVQRKLFRQDLLFRLNIFPVMLPPLRHRLEDLPLLAQHFVDKYAARDGKRLTGITLQAQQALRAHPWPGNIRELQNMIERGVILAENGQAIDVPHLFPTLGWQGEPSNNDENPSTLELAERALTAEISLPELESALLHGAVKRADGNLSAAARSLGLSRPQLAYRLKKLDE